jgi:hypothetical protein
MPEIARFFGIVIHMYFGDHHPPHFHARYQAHKAVVRIRPPGLIAGELPPRALGMVIEWARLHESELLANWLRSRNLEPLARVAPLE